MTTMARHRSNGGDFSLDIPFYRTCPICDFADNLPFRSARAARMIVDDTKGLQRLISLVVVNRREGNRSAHYVHNDDVS